ncbi:MAG: methyltransferase [Xenococcaceae cyanobacterium]
MTSNSNQTSESIKEAESLVAPALIEEFYAESYRLRKAASTMTAAAIQWFKDHSRMLVETIGARTHAQVNSQQNFTILSVGSGEGDLDIAIIQSLLPWVEYYQHCLKYVAIEPNADHRNRLIRNLARVSAHPAVDIRVEDGDFSDPSVGNEYQPYDLILMIHVLYYFQDSYQAICKAYQQLAPSGRLIIVHQEETGIPQIQHQYMKDLKGNEVALLTAEMIQTLLRKQGHSFDYHSLYACLDITECLACSEIGISIMSFCLECDLRGLKPDKLVALCSAFQRLARSKGNGQLIIDEPIGVFVLSKSGSHIITDHPRVHEDQDPTVDYWQLARHFYWSNFLSPFPETQPLRILDIACGTGRWIQALQYYVKLPEQQNEIMYDLLDPNSDAIANAEQRLKPPFHLGQKYPYIIQFAPLKPHFYDLLWSMHGFYIIHRKDLNSIVTQCKQLLKPNGFGWIALTTRQSFYVDFYDKYLDCFFQGQGQRFTAAEDVVDALTDCGIGYQINRIFYEECVLVSDLATVEYYIKTESVVNSFAQKTESNQLVMARDISLKELMSAPQMRSYLDNLVQDDFYCFPQEVWLISFRGD